MTAKLLDLDCGDFGLAKSTSGEGLRARASDPTTTLHLHFSGPGPFLLLLDCGELDRRARV